MRAYLIRRLLLIIPTLFILTIIVFLAVRFIPGDAVDVILASMESSELAQRETLERMLGLDVPVYVQYGRWIGVLPTPDWVTGEPQFRGLLQGTFGDSMRGWSPSVALIPFKEDPLGNLGMFLIPAVILGTGMSAATMRMMRTMMLEVLRQDYIRTAWSKGLRERVVIIRHTIKNALIPVITLSACSCRSWWEAR